MPSTPTRVVASLALTIHCALCATAGAQNPEPGWHIDLGRGADAARASGKPLLVVFRCVR